VKRSDIREVKGLLLFVLASLLYIGGASVWQLVVLNIVGGGFMVGSLVSWLKGE